MVNKASVIRPEDVAAIENARRLLGDGRDARSVGGYPLRELPEDTHLTAQQAGEILGISRPAVLRLIRDGEIAFEQTGRLRRITLRAVVTFAKRAAARREALDRMAREAYAAGLYDCETVAEQEIEE